MVPATEGLRPLLEERVWVAVTEEGRPLREPPVVEADGAQVRFGVEDLGPGIWPIVVTPQGGVDRVRLHVRTGGIVRTAELPVRWPDPSAAVMPEKVDVALGGSVDVRITTDAAPEDLEVQAAEGVASLKAVDGGVLLTLHPGEQPGARVYPIAVRDRRTSDQPAWLDVRVHARPRIPLEAEPGATASLRVGERRYGPFTADDEGRIAARIVQYPGDAAVEVTLEDDLGNQGSSLLPLTQPTQPSLLLIEGHRVSASRAPRLLWVRAVSPSGRDWAPLPSCRTPSSGSLPVERVRDGVFAVVLPGQERAREERVECRIEEASGSVRVGPRPRIPSSLRLQVWPVQLSTDLPVADVRVALEDALGDRLPVDGVQLEARRGTFTSIRREGDVLRAEYDGAGAAENGTDQIVARAPMGNSELPPRSIALSWAAVPVSGQTAVQIVVRDVDGRRVSGAPVTLVAGDTPVEGVTDARGEALLRVDVPAGSAPVAFVARSGEAVVRGLASREHESTHTVDSRGRAEEVRASKTLTLSPGRVAGITLTFEPPILRTGRSSVAYIQVALEDRAGRPISDEPVQLEVGEGTTGPLIPRPDGTWVAEFSPGPGDRARLVDVVAEAGGVRTTSRLALEPRLGRLFIGPSLGWVSNLGAVSSPVVGFDLDVRTGLLSGTAMLRVGVSGYGLNARVPTSLGAEAQLTSSVIPGQLALLLRQDRGGLSFWGGGGGALALQTMTARFGAETVAEGTSVLSGGVLMGGVGYRLGVGDIVAEARWSFLPGAGGDVGFVGNLGGLTLNTGFRLVY